MTATITRFALAAGLTLGLAMAAAADDSCSYQGTAYSHGATVCQSGTQYRCNDGEWNSLAITCPDKEAGAKPCEYKGTSYSSGSASCQSGTQYRCESGSWSSLGAKCAPEPVAAPPVIPPSTRNCMLDGGSTVASGSTVCRSGVMFACDAGEWRNIGTPCQ